MKLSVRERKSERLKMCATRRNLTADMFTSNFGINNIFHARKPVLITL